MYQKSDCTWYGVKALYPLMSHPQVILEILRTSIFLGMFAHLFVLLVLIHIHTHTLSYLRIWWLKALIKSIAVWLLFKTITYLLVLLGLGTECSSPNICIATISGLKNLSFGCLHSITENKTQVTPSLKVAVSTWFLVDFLYTGTPWNTKLNN